jgi:predicted small metal-binding protein
MREFRCRDAGMDCDYVARGASDREVMDQAFRHAHDAHGMSRDRELEDRVLGLIRDEGADDDRQSMGGLIP